MFCDGFYKGAAPTALRRSRDFPARMAVFPACVRYVDTLTGEIMLNEEFCPTPPNHLLQPFGIDLARAGILTFQDVKNDTCLLHEMQSGDPEIAEELLRRLYPELRQVAARLMENERPDHTLQPTILVHDAWLRLTSSGQIQRSSPWANKQHFVRAAAKVMRQSLIDHARKRNAQRRGEGKSRINLDDIDLASEADDDTLLAVNEALTKLEALDSNQAQLVELRFFLDMSFAEAAEALGVSESTAKRDWVFTKAWLCNELRQFSSNPPPA